LQSQSAASNPGDAAEVRRNIVRLRENGAKSTTVDPSQLHDGTRTFHIANPSGISGSATFHVAIMGQDIEQGALADGAPELLVCAPELKGLKMPGMSPPGSRVRLFHDGVLNCSSGASSCDFYLGSHFTAASTETLAQQENR
jgi:hypothetical protein